MKNIKVFCSFMLLLLVVTAAVAHGADYSKMSPFVREAAMYVKTPAYKAQKSLMQTMAEPTICAFVKTKEQSGEQMLKAGCRILAQFGDIYIADIPLQNLYALSQDKTVERIEAGRVNRLCLDTTSVVVDAVRAYSGVGLPQAFDGTGVVLGVMDVGFDLTHPNFRDASQKRLRIKRFWDQLSPDSLGSSLYVGADYRLEREILSYAHSLDAMIETHGTHTLGIATGTGFDTPYRGVAPGADLCLVSNAVNTDIPLIPQHLLYKYTTATDALGFKYIFDYADEVGKPCVISFSEGSSEALDGEQQLFYEVLSKMTGRGRIIVASAGNCGYYNNYLHKPSGKPLDGILMKCGEQQGSLTVSSADDFKMKIALGASGSSPGVTKVLSSRDVLLSEDSLFVDSLEIGQVKCVYHIQAYRSSLPSHQYAYDMIVDMPGGVGQSQPLSLGIMGDEADVSVYGNSIWFFPGEDDSSYSGGESKCNVVSPGAASSVICVGATSYRDSYADIYGQTHVEPWGNDGGVAVYSSKGPTRYGLVKPDVVAPGTCVRSSYSSYYMEANEDAGQHLCSRSDFNGRSYGWGSLTGTSQATPVVSGAIALWLQANPELSPEDIFGIFSQTCNQLDAVDKGEKSCSSGYGEIDVYAGLLRVLGLDGINGISHNNPSKLTILNLGGGVIELYASDIDNAPREIGLSVYSLSGKKILDTPVSFVSGRARVPLSFMPDDIVVVQTRSSVEGFKGSVLIRK